MLKAERSVFGPSAVRPLSMRVVSGPLLMSAIGFVAPLIVSPP